MLSADPEVARKMASFATQTDSGMVTTSTQTGEDPLGLLLVANAVTNKPRKRFHRRRHTATSALYMAGAEEDSPEQGTTLTDFSDVLTNRPFKKRKFGD